MRPSNKQKTKELIIKLSAFQALVLVAHSTQLMLDSPFWIIFCNYPENVVQVQLKLSMVSATGVWTVQKGHHIALMAAATFRDVIAMEDVEHRPTTRSLPLCMRAEILTREHSTMAQTKPSRPTPIHALILVILTIK